jgi:hypothetical protein
MKIPARAQIIDNIVNRNDLKLKTVNINQCVHVWTE